MKKRNLKVMAMMAAAVLALSGCSGGGNTATEAPKSDSSAAATEAAADTKAADDSKTADSGKTAAPTNYPTKSIDLVVPFTAGGNVDLSCRILAQEMEKELGQPVSVLNKEGGGAVIGQTYVANSKPDGYTLLAMTSSFVTNVLSGTTTYDMDSIIPVAEYCFDPEIIVASADSGIETIDQFVEEGKKRELLNTTPGFSTSHHIASLLFSQKTDVQFEYMHTNGSSEQTVQLAGGHAEVGFTTYAGAASLIDQGKIKVLAICSDERSENLPDVPTLKESGIDFTYGSYRGIGVPAGTPDEIVQYLSDTMESVMNSDEVKDQFANSGLPITYANSSDLKAMLDEDYTNMESIQDLLKE